MDLVDVVLRKMFGVGYYVRQRKPLVIPEISEVEPEPDIAVVPGSIRDYATSHPTTAKLIVEVADITLSYDREVKGSLYAKAGITEYWILNLRDRHLEVYCDPAPDITADYGFSYSSFQVYKSDQLAAPMGMLPQAIKVEDLLP